MSTGKKVISLKDSGFKSWKAIEISISATEV